MEDLSKREIVKAANEAALVAKLKGFVAAGERMRDILRPIGRTIADRNTRALTIIKVED